ncbi:hypothetical protein AQUCO_01600311v1 [Aquilegia coerulea]|uniref:Dof zinc finger protein n=1 Tax=Aquilegia coerulea TaxID=218851 RepID=A0A2G5DRB0_AQUCA|nr:hypothetical protein AQUCO_01600311v1 [Aquilegia coerulea]
MVAFKCPHCESTNTRFAYQMKSQRRHYCNDCRRHWTVNGKLRNFPVSGGKRERRQPEISASDQGLIALECPWCEGTNTKFIHYQHQNESKPVHFCNKCQRQWTVGGTLRGSPGGGNP